MAGFMSVITRAKPDQRGWLSLMVMNTAATVNRPRPAALALPLGDSLPLKAGRKF